VSQSREESKRCQTSTRSHPRTVLQWLGGVQTTLVLAAAMLAVALPTALSPAMHHAPPLGEARHEAVEPAGE